MNNRNFVLGIDTSNYKTSAALVDADSGEIICDERQLLRVKQGERGLRQSDALFQHIENLPALMEKTFAKNKDGKLAAIAYSARPRPIEGSYMPVFRAGEALAKSMGAAMNIPVFPFSHQEGHIEAVRHGTIFQSEEQFLCYHLSGGTSELLKIESGIPRKIGGSKDLAFGQVIDRAGVAAGMAFPAGEEMDAIAAAHQNKKYSRLKPVPMDGLNWNLSGIETQCSRAISAAESGEERAELIGELFQRIADVLVKLTLRASEQEHITSIMFTGGVSSSQTISRRIKEQLKGKSITAEFGDQQFSQDNAVGTALLGRKALLWQ